MPLSHRPGHAQADFGKADGYIGGEKVRFHYFCMDLPHSDSCFVKAYPAETAEAFCDGRVVVLDFVSGVPKSILYDNLWTPPAQGDLFGVGGGNARIYVLPERSRRWPGWESAAFRRITPSASKALSYIRLGKLQSLRRAIDAPYGGHGRRGDPRDVAGPVHCCGCCHNAAHSRFSGTLCLRDLYKLPDQIFEAEGRNSFPFFARGSRAGLDLVDLPLVRSPAIALQDV